VPVSREVYQEADGTQLEVIGDVRAGKRTKVYDPRLGEATIVPTAYLTGDCTLVGSPQRKNEGGTGFLGRRA
jgi:hypothetical protein